MPDVTGNDLCAWHIAGSTGAGPNAVNGVADLLGGLAMNPVPSQVMPHPNLLGASGGLAPHPMASANLGTPGLFGSSGQGFGGGPSLGPNSASAGPGAGVHMGGHGIYPTAAGIGPQSAYTAMPYMPQALGPQGGYGGTAVAGAGMPYGGVLPVQGVSTYGGLTSTNPGGKGVGR